MNPPPPAKGGQTSTKERKNTRKTMFDSVNQNSSAKLNSSGKKTQKFKKSFLFWVLLQKICVNQIRITEGNNWYFAKR